MTRRDGLTGVLVGLLLWAVVQPARAQTDTARAERQIKAAFLLKFLGFVDWPPPAFDAAEAPLRVGLVGADALADELVQMARRRQVNGRPVLVRKLPANEPPTGLHALFIGRGAMAQMSDLLAQARRQPLLLVVADADEATTQGAAIAFAVADDKVRFDVAPAAAEQAGLKISSRLMAVARRVVTP